MVLKSLAFFRRRRGLSQHELAAVLGTNRHSIIRLEAGVGSTKLLAAAMATLDITIANVGDGDNLGDQLRERRSRRGWTITEVAKRAGIAPKTVVALERGDATVSSLLKLLAVLAPNAKLHEPLGHVPRRPCSNSSLKNVRARTQDFEVFRTPSFAFEELHDYRPDWFAGVGYDPSAGDGRMMREIIARGNPGPHYLNDIRSEELPAMSAIPNVVATVGDYLTITDPPKANFLITNPPFTLATDFVIKARSHISGPICILQSIAWQSTAKRSEWLRNAGLALVLNLKQRPKWEVDGGGKAPSNIWDFAWFVFLPDHRGLPVMDWR